MKIGCAFLRYAYGHKARGDAMEAYGIYPVLREMGHESCVFWVDEYLNDKHAMHTKILEFADREKPDILFFILMKDEIPFKTLLALKERCVTVNWFGDDTWRFDHFTKVYAPYFTYAVTTDKYSLEKYRRCGYDHVILSQWASWGYADTLVPEDISYEYDVSFAGMYSGHREWIIKKLRKKGLRLGCFGHGWPDGIMPYDKLGDLFRKSRINLNLSNSVSYDIRCLASGFKPLREFVGAKVKKGKKITQMLKARNFEIPAFGGFQLTNYVPGLEDYFLPGRDVAVYATVEDIMTQIHDYLKHEDKRRAVMMNGYKRAKEGHLYRDRFEQVLKEIQKR